MKTPTDEEIVAELLRIRRYFGNGFNWPVPVDDKRLRRELLRLDLIAPNRARGRKLTYFLTDAGKRRLVDVPGSGITQSRPLNL